MPALGAATPADLAVLFLTACILTALRFLGFVPFVALATRYSSAERRHVAAILLCMAIVLLEFMLVWYIWPTAFFKNIVRMFEFFDEPSARLMWGEDAGRYGNDALRLAWLRTLWMLAGAAAIILLALRVLRSAWRLRQGIADLPSLRALTWLALIVLGMPAILLVNLPDAILLVNTLYKPIWIELLAMLAAAVITYILAMLLGYLAHHSTWIKTLSAMVLLFYGAYIALIAVAGRLAL